ncbi:MAG: XdhC family protein [Chryseolinea sp.]
MKEFKNILSEYKKIDLSKRKAALATVVQVRGSSYRSPGARMLITDDGKWVGSISGGCLEGDALRQARQVMSNKKPLTVTYDTREESNQNLGIGLGCNGVIDVLIEPVEQHDANHAIDLFERIVTANSTVALATIFEGNEGNIGAKILCDDRSRIFSNVVDTRLETLIREDLQILFETQTSQARKYNVDQTETTAFIELIQPSVSLIIFGGGFDARPVCQLAKSLGWNVTVTDECVAHIAPLFFPTADNLSLCQRSFIDRDFDLTPYTACVLMSHNYEYDRDVLRKLVNTPTPYIGILGPRKRFEKMLAAFAEEGIQLSEDHHHRIHSPIGLDIGAETPDEIAISIIAEIQSRFANRSGAFLKHRTEPIHQRDTLSDQVFKQVISILS